MGNYVFLEKGAGAQSLCNLWNRLASTSGLMRVSVSAGRLEVAPSNIWVLAIVRMLCLDLEHRIRVDMISSVFLEGKFWGYSKILLSYTGPGGREHLIRLFLKKPREFFEALGKNPPAGV